MKKQTKIWALVLFFAVPLTTLAASFDYTPMESIPGGSGSGDFYDYVKDIYNFGIWTVGIAALLMIMIGGYMYLTSAGNNASMEKAKGVITDAIVGLVMAMLAYLLLYIINPDLVKLGSTGTTTTGATTGTTTTEGTTTAGTYTNDEAVAKLSSAGISVSSSGNCSDQNNSSCTSLTDIPTTTIDYLITIKNSCSATVTVTGGTETGHTSHGSGKSVVDLSFNTTLASCISSKTSTFNISKICTTSADSAYRYNCTTNESVEHLHVAFSS